MNPLRYVNDWKTVAFTGVICTAIVLVFVFAGPDERLSLLTTLGIIGTAIAASLRQAFAVPPPAASKRIELPRVNPRGAHRCAKCDRIPGPDGECHLADCPWKGTQQTSDEDDDDPGAGGEVLAEEPPTKPQPRTPVRITGHPRSLVRSIMRHGFAFAMLLLSACSPSALQTHATIASVTGHVFDAACTEVEVARSREQHAIADGPLDREASVAAVDAVRAHWAPALASCELAADTHDAWVTALALAAAGAPFTLADGIALAERALEVWRSLTATLATAGVTMPALPPELVALTGGAL